jgi:hypothetical protein
MHIVETFFSFTNCSSQHFYDCTLKVDIGEFKSGSIIDTIILDIENSELIFLPTSELDYNLYPISEKSYKINLALSKQ